jgi:hypothetical protein
MGCTNAPVRLVGQLYHYCGHETLVFVAPVRLPRVYPFTNTPLFAQESRSNLFPDCIWFEFVYRQPWVAHSRENVLWETMVFLPNQTPLFQIKHSPHAALLSGLCQETFTDATNTLKGLLPNVDHGIFGCLHPVKWIDDNVISLFIDCLRRGIPEPSSAESGEVQSPSMLHSTKGIQLDFSEVCILDSQHARTIRTASEEGDLRKVFRVLGGFCKFNTVQHLLVPLNTSGNSIAHKSGTHWMLAEVCFESKVVCIYDWLPGKFQGDYEQIVGVYCVYCFAFHVSVSFHGQGYFRAPVCVMSESLLPECLLDMCPLGLAAPLVQLLDVAQARCNGITPGEGISRVQVVKSDFQQNGHDDVLNFRYMPLTGHKPPSRPPQSHTHCCHSPPSADHGALCLLRAAHVCTFLTHAVHAVHVLLPAAHAYIRLLRAAHACKLNAVCRPCNILFTLPSPCIHICYSRSPCCARPACGSPWLYTNASCSPCMQIECCVQRIQHPVDPTSSHSAAHSLLPTARIQPLMQSSDMTGLCQILAHAQPPRLPPRQPRSGIRAQ